MADDKTAPDNTAAEALIEKVLHKVLDERDAKRQRDLDDAEAAKPKGLLGGLFG